MKKMLILAGVAMLAMVSSAASLKWSITAGSWDSSVTKPGAGKLYYVVTAADATSGALATALSSANKDAISAALASATLAKSTGTFSAASSLANGSLSGDSVTVGTTYQAVLISFDAATIDDATQFFVSGASSDGTGYAPPATPAATATWSKTGTMVTGTWKSFAGDVPEPTSAMLLLLGVAGLALKRRHA